MPKTSPEYALRSQRQWLLEHFLADHKVVTLSDGTGVLVGPANVSKSVKPMCRCWHCGKLLGERALFVSKVDPAGSTRRNNIRPACADHAS